MDLVEHKRLILKNSKVGWIEYETKFVDPLNDGTVKKICKRYGCEMKGEREELQAPHDSQPIQAILAIYAWIRPDRKKRGIMHDKGE
nr:hypothetical protein [Limosilactobacillus mucosae]